VAVWKQFPLRLDGLVDRRALTGCRLQREFVDNGAAARNSTETALVNLWKDVLKARQVSVQDNFFEMGGDSLAAATLQTRIEKELGKRLPLAAFFQAPTVAGQAALLMEQQDSDAASRVFTLRHAEGETPLFLFHYLTSSQKLAAHFPLERPVYGIDSAFDEELRLWERTGEVRLTMQELARRCAADVRAVQAEGPYCLAGFCYGGVVAFAVAHQLAAQGQQVSFVGLLDAFYKPGIKPVRFPALQRWIFHANKTFQQGPGYLVRKLKQRWEFIQQQRTAGKRRVESNRTEPSDAEKTHLRRIEFMRQIINAYKSEPYAGSVTVFRAVADPHPFDFDFGSNGWQEIVCGGVSLEDFECSHLDLSEEPHVKELAERLERYMRRP
jgi:thioesterase domain-containing protein/acyl carrier protein